jgi:flagellar assembly factor FliW
MTKINTTRFGELEIDESKIITFTQGPIGFSFAKDYIRLANQLGEETPFRWLQSVKFPDMAFVIVDPLSFLPEYQVNIRKEEVEDLAMEAPEDIKVYTVVVIPEKVHDMTANLRAPILINENKRLAKQIILQDTDYSLRYQIMHEMEKRVEQIKKQGKVPAENQT